MNDFYQKYSDNLIHFRPFAFQKTGLIQNQTILKINDYMLICSPYQISMKNAVLLLILSQEEIKFFQKYQNSKCLLGLVFQKSSLKAPLSIDLQGTITQIGAVKGRKAVCMINMGFNKQNMELIQILGNYIANYNALKEYFEQYREKPIQVSRETAADLRYNNYAECFFGTTKVIAQLQSFTSSNIIFTVPALLKESLPEKLEKESPVSIKLYFQLYRFMASGKISTIEDIDRNSISITAAVDFIPELVEIMDDYFYRMNLKK